MIKATLRKPTSPATGGETVSSSAVAKFEQEIGSPVIDVEATAVVTGTAPSGATPLALAPVNAAPPPATAGNNYTDASDGGLEGDFDGDDLRLPQLKIVNGSGPLSQEFNGGSLIYADELLWSPPDPKAGAANPIMRFVPIKITKQYRENLTEDEIANEQMPRIVATREEAERLGGTQWIDNQKPRWSPSATCLLFLEEPEGCTHPGFNTVLDGKNYAPCVYYASGLGYRESAKVIFNTAQTQLKENGRIVLHKRFWTWQVVKSKGGKFTVFVPSLRLTKDETGPEMRAMVASFTNNKPVMPAVV